MKIKQDIARYEEDYARLQKAKRNFESTIWNTLDNLNRLGGRHVQCDYDDVTRKWYVNMGHFEQWFDTLEEAYNRILEERGKE